MCVVRHLTCILVLRWCVVRDGAADFKVGLQNRIRERSERKKICLPPLFQMWGYKQANISRGPIAYIKICCLVVALINVGSIIMNYIITLVL